MSTPAEVVPLDLQSNLLFEAALAGVPDERRQDISLPHAELLVLAQTSPPAVRQALHADFGTVLDIHSVRDRATHDGFHYREARDNLEPTIISILRFEHGDATDDELKNLAAQDKTLTDYSQSSEKGFETAASANRRIVASKEALARYNGLRLRRERLGRGAAALAMLPGVAFFGLLTAGAALLSTYNPNAEVPTTTTVPVTANANTNQANEGGNPFSPNFHLTGQEAAADRAAIAPIISFAQKHHDKVVSVRVFAESSDDAQSEHAGLGHSDAGNGKLAQLRKAKAIDEMQAVADEDHVSLDGTKVISDGQEYVLNQGEVGQIDQAATALHEPTETLIQQYDDVQGKHSSGRFARMLDKVIGKHGVRIIDVLNHNIGNHREVHYSVTLRGEKTVQKQNVLSETIALLPDMRIVAAIGIAGMIGYGLVSSILLSDRVAGRLAHRRARRQLRKTADVINSN